MGKHPSLKKHATVEIRDYSSEQETELLHREESHFLDFKRACVTPGKLQETVVALANAGGGEVVIGLDDDSSLSAVKRFYGFRNPENANNHVSVADVLRLTAAKAKSRGEWELPGWFYPRNNQSPLSYHPDVKAFTRKGNQTILRSTGRGQEFILNTARYPEAVRWAKQLITNAR